MSTPPAQAPAAAERSYGSGARILSIGIASTGVLTFAYFSIASHVVDKFAADRLDVLWSVMFVIISVIYRPIEQLLSRSIADRLARGLDRHTLGVPIAIQAAFALVFLAVALALHDTLVTDVFDGYAALYWVLVVGTLPTRRATSPGGGWPATSTSRSTAGSSSWRRPPGWRSSSPSRSASPTARRRWRSGSRRPRSSRWSSSRRRSPDSAGRRQPAPAPASASAPVSAESRKGLTGAMTMRGGTGFALSVSGIQLAEQSLLNAAVLTVEATSPNHALAGIVFNVLLITRAPLQLFQAIQTSLLPHLAGLEATRGTAAFGRAIRTTILAISGFSGAVALGLLAIGPFAMRHLFGQDYPYNRFGLAVIAVGMGLHLCSGALNQAALARGQAAAAAATWLAVAAVFVVWMVLPVIGDQMLRVEVGYSGAAAVLALGLGLLYRRGASTAAGA